MYLRIKCTLETDINVEKNKITMSFMCSSKNR